MSYDTNLSIGGRQISITSPCYFIADIAANHDGELSRAKELIFKAKEAGADCAKFQHFLAEKIVSDVGFKALKTKQSHQASWKKSVAEIYDQYHSKREWNEELVATCQEANIEFMTTPYDFEAIELLGDDLNAFKVGSGDITFKPLLEKIAATGKTVILASGASSIDEVEDAVNTILDINPKLCLMQCNTNYTGELENFRYVNLNVLKTFATKWPEMVLGLSDHTPGHSAVLGAVSFGARVIEKHFTDDNKRVGPDHSFALDPSAWREMVDRTRELELALGDGVKRIEANEKETVVIQRRSVRLVRELQASSLIDAKDLECLRPCPAGAVNPMDLSQVVGKRLLVNKPAGAELYWTDLE